MHMYVYIYTLELTDAFAEWNLKIGERKIAFRANLLTVRCHLYFIY